MKKIERRAVVCVFLALILAAGLGVFLVRYCLDGGSWASLTGTSTTLTASSPPVLC